MITPLGQACTRCDCTHFVGGDAARYCAECGHERSSHGKSTCSSCGSPLPSEGAFCTSCGAPVTRLPGPQGPSDAETLGRGVGERLGYTARAAVAVAAQPVADATWRERPSIPTWQKVLGVVAWPLMVLTPHGLVFLGASFLVMVVLGRHNPYSWAVWVTKWASYFLVATVALILVVVLIYLSLHSSSNAAALLIVKKHL